MFVMWPIPLTPTPYYIVDATLNDISSLSKHVDEAARWLSRLSDQIFQIASQFSFENAQLKRQYGEETETVKRDKR